MLKKASVGQGQLAYEDNEKMGLPTIVMVHGNSHSHQVFKYQFNSYLGNNYRLIGVDLPGHGASSWALDQGAYGLPGMGQMLASLVESLGVQDAYFAGHSLGGHVLLEASRSLPQARGFFVWGTPPIANLEDLSRAFHPHPAMAGLFQAYLNEAESEAFAKACYAETFPDWAFSLGLIRSCDPKLRESLGQSVQKGLFTDERNIAQELGPRLGIAHSENDALVRREYFQELDLSKSWKESLIILEGCGHTPQMERPELFNLALHTFIQDRERALVLDFAEASL